jgi:putative glutathione S-transferase
MYAFKTQSIVFLMTLKEFSNIYQYMLELYQLPSISVTVNMPHIKRRYYARRLTINTYGIAHLRDKF